MEDTNKFSWDDDWFNDDKDFIEPEAAVVEPTESEETPATITLDTPEEEETPEETVEEQPEESTPEKPLEEEEEEVEGSTEEVAELEATDAYKEMVAGLKLQGLVKNDSNDLDEILDQIEESTLTAVEQGVETVMKNLKESIGDEGTQYLQFLKNGGTTAEYMKLNSTGALDAFDVNSEAGQEQFLRYYFSKVEGESPEEVEDRIEFIINSDKLETYASRYYGRLQENKKQERQELLRQRDEQVKQRAQQERLRRESLRKGILGVKEVSDFKFKPTEKREIFNYLTNPTVDVGNGKFVPEFVAEINRYQTEEPEKLALLVKLMRNDFDFSEIRTKEKTRVSRVIKKGIQAETNDKPKLKTTPDDAPVWDKYFE